MFLGVCETNCSREGPTPASMSSTPGPEQRALGAWVPAQEGRFDSKGLWVI